jgi:hypothetical protein
MLSSSIEREAQKDSYEDADQSLHKELLLSLGSRIRLTQNIWAGRGLMISGSMGNVHDIPMPAPKALLVRFGDYIIASTPGSFCMICTSKSLRRHIPDSRLTL